MSQLHALSIVFVHGFISGTYARRGSALGAPPPPTWEKSSAQKCPNEERKFRPDMSAKIMCMFHSDMTKLKQKR